MSQSRPEQTLPVTLFNEYKRYKDAKAYLAKTGGRAVKKVKVLSKEQTLAELRYLAADRQTWRKLAEDVCDLIS